MPLHAEKSLKYTSMVSEDFSYKYPLSFVITPGYVLKLLCGIFSSGIQFDEEHSKKFNGFCLEFSLSNGKLSNRSGINA